MTDTQAPEANTCGCGRRAVIVTAGGFPLCASIAWAYKGALAAGALPDFNDNSSLSLNRQDLGA